MLSDLEAAKRRAEKVVSEIIGNVHRALHGGKVEPGLVLHNTLRPAVGEMQQRLIDIYAQLEGAEGPPLRDELITSISDRVIAFVRSTVAGIRGPNVGAAARVAAELEASVRMSAASAFDLAVYDANKASAPLDPPAPADTPTQAVLDARAAFSQLTIHPEILRVCSKQFTDGHYREAILNASIALVEFVKQRAGAPVDKAGKPLDGTSLMQQVFGTATPILKVNDLKTPTDQDEQQGMMFLFSGAALGLRNPRAHGLDPDTAEYAVEAIVFLSFLAKVADSAKT